MARPLRPQVPWGLYHITTRGNRRSAIFFDDRDRRRFLSILGVVVRAHRWACHAYCLLTTHYHLFLTTPEPDIARGMQLLNGVYAQSFNRRHRCDGHVFQGRYFSVLVETETHALELCRYIALNPVRAGMCVRPESWTWSSYAATLGIAPKPNLLTIDWLLGNFADEPDAARGRLRSFVEAGRDTAETAGEKP